MAEIEIVRELDIVFWTVANVSTLFNLIFCASRMINKKVENSMRKANFVFFLYFFFMLTANILGVVWRLYILEIHGPEFAGLLEDISLIMLNCGWLCMIAYLDLRMRLLKHPYFLFVMIGILPLSFIVRFHTATPLEYVYFILVVLGFSLSPLLYFMIALKSEGVLKLNALRLGHGALFFGLGLLIQKQNIEPFLPEVVNFFDLTLHIPYIIIPPILIFTSMVLYWLGIYNLYGGFD
jgi:hypothetical protein